jgi:TonB family protein
VNTPKPAPPKPKSGPAIKIDASDVARNLSRIPTQPGPPGGGGGGGSADSYKAKVIQVLWRLWKPPVQKANEGIPVIHFTISANGVITGARLTQSSGDPGLDRSVTDIFTQTVQVPAPPGGRPMELTVNFIRDY